MFKRVMVAVVGVPFLLFVLVWAPEWATMVLLAGMCGLGAFELMRAAAGEKGKRLIPLTVLTAALVPVCLYAMCEYTHEELGITMGLPLLPLWLPVLGLVFVFLLFVYAITHYGKESAIPFASLTAAILGGLVFPMMLSCLLLLRMIPYTGKVMVFMPLCISFGSDTCAYFAGLALGKHKLAPLVSPKKTIEGSAGGIIGGVLGMVLLNVIAVRVFRDPFMTPTQILIFGVVGSVISQIGDLSFSVVKREFGVKDYGKLLPGHGGILDRFDSVTFVAPFIYLTLSMFWTF